MVTSYNKGVLYYSNRRAISHMRGSCSCRVIAYRGEAFGFYHLQRGTFPCNYSQSEGTDAILVISDERRLTVGQED